MNEHRTTSILQRVPVILAVTAASYGLPLLAQASRSSNGSNAVAARASAQNRAVSGTVALMH
jgi:hypothetical protein